MDDDGSIAALHAALPHLSDGSVVAFVQPSLLWKYLFARPSPAAWRAVALAALPRVEDGGGVLRVRLGIRAPPAQQYDEGPPKHGDVAVDVEGSARCLIVDLSTCGAAASPAVMHSLVGHLRFCAHIAHRFRLTGKLSVTVRDCVPSRSSGGERSSLLFFSGLLDMLGDHDAHLLAPQRDCSSAAALALPLDTLVAEDPCLLLSWFSHHRVELSRWAFRDVRTLASLADGRTTSLACVRNVSTGALSLVPLLTTWLSRGSPLSSLVGLTSSCPKLVALDLSETRVTDADLRLLSRLAFLERLELESCTEITSLDALTSLTRLRILLVAGSERLVSFSKAVQSLSRSFGGQQECRTASLVEFSVSASSARSLTELMALTTVARSALDDRGFEGRDGRSDVQLVALERLAIHGAVITDRAAPTKGPLAARAIRLKSLALVSCPPWTIGSMIATKAFVSRFSSLVTLVVRDCDFIRAAADLTDVLQALPHLNDIVLDRLRIPPHVDVTSSLQFLLIGGAISPLGHPRKWKRVLLRGLPLPHDVDAAQRNVQLASIEQFDSDWNWASVGLRNGLSRQLR